MDNLSRSLKVPLLVALMDNLSPTSVAATGRRTGSRIRLDKTNIPNTGASIGKLELQNFALHKQTKINMFLGQALHTVFTQTRKQNNHVAYSFSCNNYCVQVHP